MTTSERNGSCGGFSLLELLVSIAVIAVLAALGFGALATAKKYAQSVNCRSNLRQLGIAIRLYADDNEGRLPVFRSAAKPGGTNVVRVALQSLPEKVFRCPSDFSGFFEQNGCSYDANGEAGGRLLHKLTSESTGPGNGLLFDHDESWHGYVNVLYPDGRVEKRK